MTQRPIQYGDMEKKKKLTEILGHVSWEKRIAVETTAWLKREENQITYWCLCTRKEGAMED